MLNGRGGFVLFGVTDQGDIIGQEVSAQTLEQVIQELKRIEPYALLNPEVIPLDHTRSVLVVPVPSGGSSPYTYDGRPYVRQGPTTSVMPYQRDEPGTRDPEALLLGLGLIREGQLLNAAVVLYAKSDRLLPYYTQCLLRMARFRGVTMSAFEDNRQVYGHAFDLFIEAQRFLRQHLPVAGRIVPGLFERIDDPLYPPEALREALANAICHRDYATGSGSIGVAIYDDRLEISSIGRLPFGQTPADLTRPHPSQPWNPLIAGVFYRRGLIETWGRGTLKIAELTEEAGLAPPEFEEQAGAVKALAMLSELNLVDLTGHGRGARWMLRRAQPGLDEKDA